MLDQARFPLATVVSEAYKRAPRQSIRLLCMAMRESRAREASHGIPTLVEA